MQRNASQSNPQVALPDSSTVHIRRQREAQYQRVYDERKRPIRGLWVRNGRYYAQLTVEDDHTGQSSRRRVPLEGRKAADMPTFGFHRQILAYPHAFLCRFSKLLWARFPRDSSQFPATPPCQNKSIHPCAAKRSISIPHAVTLCHPNTDGEPMRSIQSAATMGTKFWPSQKPRQPSNFSLNPPTRNVLA